MKFSPARRFLGAPAWAWVFLPLILSAVIKIIGPPGPLLEPSDIDLMFRDGLLFTRTGDSFRFVPFAQHKLVKPLWWVERTITTQTTLDWGLGKDAAGFHLGFYKRTAHWQWSLDTRRFDEEGTKESATEISLSGSEMQELMPVLVAELNHRSVEEHWGDALNKVLHEGREKTSYVCIQNVLILSVWLSLVVALSAVAAMFFGKNGAARDVRLPDRPVADPGEPR
jgi:hypothetical protein